MSMLYSLWILLSPDGVLVNYNASPAILYLLHDHLLSLQILAKPQFHSELCQSCHIVNCVSHVK